MNSQEFERQAKTLLYQYDIPDLFHVSLIDFAYDHEHGFGYENVLSYLQELAYRLQVPFQEYRREVEIEVRNADGY